MRRLVRGALPVAIAAVAVALTFAGVGSFDEFGLSGIAYASGWVAFALIGAFLAWKRPENAVGWLFAVIGLAAMIGLQAEDPSGPGTVAIAFGSMGVPYEVTALLSGLWFASFVLLPALLILFPDGRPPSPRWRLVLWAIALTLPIGTLTSGDEPSRAAVAPVLIAAFGSEAGLSMVDALQGIASMAMMGFIALGAVSIGMRARRSRGTERQQLKWIAFGGALLAGTILFTFVAFFSPLRALDPDAEFPVTMFEGIPFVISLVSLPVSAAFAILRYRLYDIDVLINRALVYAALSTMLGAAYIASVVALQTVLRPLTAGNDIAVAVSTLAVVALFQPVRGRIQDAVDRRFYRAHYDAQRTLDAFAGRLRDQVDLGDLEREIVDVVRETVRPRHATLWLRRGS